MQSVKLPNIIPTSTKTPGQTNTKMSPCQNDVFLNNKIEEETARAITKENELEAMIISIPTIKIGTKNYRFYIKVEDNQPKLVFEEI